MDFLERLDEAVKLPNVYYHKFMLSYKSASNDIYVFCEGGVDLSYYCEQIDRIRPGKVMQKYPVEGKKNVLQIWTYINWDNYQKNRILFFVDRDLSYWVGEPQEYDSNVYVTDGYSFENDAISSHMFLKLLEDIYGFANYSSKEKDRILELYKVKMNSFTEGSYDLMGYILYKYQYDNEHSARYINIHKCLDLSAENIWKNTIKGISRDEYIKNALKVDQDITDILENYKNRFVNDCVHYSIRGKWCLDFMIDLLDYVFLHGEEYAPSLYKGITKKPKKLQELTERGAMTVIAPRMAPAESLKQFIIDNIRGNDE